MSRLALSLSLCLAATGFAQKPQDAKPKPRFAVLYFEPRTANPDLEGIAKGFASMLTADFANNDQLVVVERERLEDVLAELKLGETRFADQKTFAKVGGLLGAQYLLVGSFMGTAKKLAVSARLVRLPDGADVGGANAFATEDDVFDAEQAIVKQIAERLIKLGVPPPSAAAAPARTGKLPLKACKLYAKALDAKDKKDTATAKALLGQVVKEQPDFKVAQLDLLSLTN